MRGIPDLKTLQILVAVGESGSFGAAAGALGISQQAVSGRVRAAEQATGLELFRRTNTGALPTGAGHAVLTSAREVLAAAEVLGEDIARERDPGREVVHLSASFTVIAAYLPGWLAQVHQLRPGVTFDVASANSEAIAEEVAAGSIGLGVIESRTLPEVARHRLETRVVATDELSLAVPAGHPWAQAGRVSAAEVRQTPLVLREPGSGTRTVAEEAFGGFAVAPVAQIASQQAVLHLAETLDAPAVLPRRAIAHSALVPVACPEVDLSRPIRIVWRRGTPPRGGLACLLEVAGG